MKPVREYAHILSPNGSRRMCKNKHCREWNAPIMWRFLTSTAVFLAAAAAINGIPLGSFKAPSGALIAGYIASLIRIRWL